MQIYSYIHIARCDVRCGIFIRDKPTLRFFPRDKPHITSCIYVVAIEQVHVIFDEMVKKITRVGIHSPDIPRMRQYIGIACAEHDHITTISDVIAISHGATVNRICADPYPRIHISRASCIVMDIKTLRNYETEISYTGKLELPSINPIILKENTCTSTHTYDRHIRPWTHHMQSHSQLSLQNSTCFSRLMNDNWRSQLI